MAPSFASLITSHISSDADMLAQLNNLAFLAEGRIGDRSGTATYEVGINLGALQSQYNWPNRTAVPFSMTYDPLASLFTYNVGGASGATLNYTAPSSFDQIYIRTRSVTARGDMLVSGLVLDGVSIADTAHAALPDAEVDILWVRGFADPDDAGFTLTGYSTMSWLLVAPRQSRLAFQVIFDQLPAAPAVVVPAPSSAILAVLGLACAGAFLRKAA